MKIKVSYIYSQKSQENMNIFRKCSISIHKQYLREEKKKQLNQICLIA